MKDPKNTKPQGGDESRRVAHLEEQLAQTGRLKGQQAEKMVTLVAEEEWPVRRQVEEE